MITPEDLRQFVADTAFMTGRVPPPPGYKYRNMFEYLNRNGRTFAVAAGQPAFPRVPCHPQSCFVNAFRLARRYPRRFRYVEGVACGPIPLHHAWVVTAADEVVDPTWSRYSTVGTAYLGVVFALDEVRRLTSRTNASVLDQWERRHPAFKVAP